MVWTSTSTYALVSGFDDRVTAYDEGGVRWVYDGPAIFGARSVGSEDPDEVSVLDAVWSSVRVDAQGRRWLVGAVDEAEVERRVATYADEAAERFGVEASPEANWEDVLYEPADAGLFEAYGWELRDCDEGADMSLYNDESRTPVFNFNADEERAVAVLFFNFGSTLDPDWGPACSATFIDSSGSLLTAAHCVTDGADAFPPGKFKVCTEGNYTSESECYSVNDITVNDITVNGSWSGSTSVTRAHDYAVIDTSIFVWSDYVTLSSASDTWLEAQAITMIGYPGSVWEEDDIGCLDNEPSSTTHALYADPNLLRRDSGTVLTLTSSVLRGRFDSGPGQSGGAILAFSSGVPQHVGVLSGHLVAPTSWSGGPKTSAIRTWVLANTP